MMRRNGYKETPNDRVVCLAETQLYILLHFFHFYTQRKYAPSG